MPAPLAPLVSGTTHRRGVHLLLGGVILLPHLLLGAVFADMLAGPRGERPAVLLLLVASASLFGRGYRGASGSARGRRLVGLDLGCLSHASGESDQDLGGELLSSWQR